MNIGIIVAMSKELNLLLPLLQNVETSAFNGYEFHKGIIGNHNIVAMQCGIGKVNAAIGTTALLNNFELDLVISTGIAGGADKQMRVMDVVVADKIAYHDVWCGPGTEYGQAYGCPTFFVSSPEISALVEGENIKHGLLCSGDKFITDIKEVNEIKSHYDDALAVDMESASIAQVCFYRNMPLFCLRVISDSPGAVKDHTKQYTDFWEAAPTETFTIVHQLLLKIK